MAHITLKMLVEVVEMAFIKTEKQGVSDKYGTGTVAIVTLPQPWCLCRGLRGIAPHAFQTAERLTALSN